MQSGVINKISVLLSATEVMSALIPVYNYLRKMYYLKIVFKTGFLLTSRYYVNKTHLMLIRRRDIFPNVCICPGVI